jgi:large subunit ribosomal protein L22
MEIRATQKYYITSPRKLREVVAMIKKLTPQDASERLPFVSKRAAVPLKKVLDSAIANARQRDINVEDLAFKEIQINEGPKLKRWRAGARGRAKPYSRRMSHIRVVLETTGKSAPKTSKKKSAGKPKTVKSKDLKIAEKVTSGGKKGPAGLVDKVKKVRDQVKTRREGGSVRGKTQKSTQG